jgi:hypothetical protein
LGWTSSASVTRSREVEKKTERARTLLGRLHDKHKELQNTNGVTNVIKTDASLDNDILNEIILGKGTEGECVTNLKEMINNLMQENDSLKSKVELLEEQICEMEKRTQAEMELQLKRDKKSAQKMLNKRHRARFGWAGSSSDESDASSLSANKSGLKKGYCFPTLRYSVTGHLPNVSPSYREQHVTHLHSNFSASPMYRKRYSRNKKRGTKRERVSAENKERLFMKPNAWKKYLTKLDDEMKPAAKPASCLSKKRKVSLCPSLNQEKKIENLDKSTSEEEF